MQKVTLKILFMTLMLCCGKTDPSYQATEEDQTGPKSFQLTQNTEEDSTQNACAQSNDYENHFFPPANPPSSEAKTGNEDSLSISGCGDVEDEVQIALNEAMNNISQATQNLATPSQQSREDQIIAETANLMSEARTESERKSLIASAANELNSIDSRSSVLDALTKKISGQTLTPEEKRIIAPTDSSLGICVNVDLEKIYGPLLSCLNDAGVRHAGGQWNVQSLNASPKTVRTNACLRSAIGMFFGKPYVDALSDPCRRIAVFMGDGVVLPPNPSGDENANLKVNSFEQWQESIRLKFNILKDNWEDYLTAAKKSGSWSGALEGMFYWRERVEKNQYEITRETSFNNLVKTLTRLRELGVPPVILQTIRNNLSSGVSYSQANLDHFMSVSDWVYAGIAVQSASLLTMSQSNVVMALVLWTAIGKSAFNAYADVGPSSKFAMCFSDHIAATGAPALAFAPLLGSIPGAVSKIGAYSAQAGLVTSALLGTSFAMYLGSSAIEQYGQCIDKWKKVEETVAKIRNFEVVPNTEISLAKVRLRDGLKACFSASIDLTFAAWSAYGALRAAEAVNKMRALSHAEIMTIEELNQAIEELETKARSTNKEFRAGAKAALEVISKLRSTKCPKGGVVEIVSIERLIKDPVTGEDVTDIDLTLRYRTADGTYRYVYVEVKSKGASPTVDQMSTQQTIAENEGALHILYQDLGDLTWSNPKTGETGMYDCYANRIENLHEDLPVNHVFSIDHLLFELNNLVRAHNPTLPETPSLNICIPPREPSYEYEGEVEGLNENSTIRSDDNPQNDSTTSASSSEDDMPSTTTSKTDYDDDSATISTETRYDSSSSTSSDETYDSDSSPSGDYDDY